MNGAFIEGEALESVRQQLSLAVVPLWNRGVILMRGENKVGEVTDVSTARLLVALHNHGLALVNEVTRLKLLSEGLWRLNRELTLANPELRPQHD